MRVLQAEQRNRFWSIHRSAALELVSKAHTQQEHVLNQGVGSFIYYFRNIVIMCDYYRNYYIYASCNNGAVHFIKTSIDGNSSNKCSRAPHERFIVVPGTCGHCQWQRLCGGNSLSWMINDWAWEVAYSVRLVRDYGHPTSSAKDHCQRLGEFYYTRWSSYSSHHLGIQPLIRRHQTIRYVRTRPPSRRFPLARSACSGTFTW